jgi:CBS domain containing-hemolysin-like protein
MDNDLTLGIIFLALSTLGVILKKTYFQIPAKELKKRAKTKDEDAKVLYKAVAYGTSLKVLLWLYIALTAAASFVLFAKALDVFFGLILLAILMYVIFSLLPVSTSGGFGMRITRLMTPPIVWVLNYLHPAFAFASKKVERIYASSEHTGIYDMHDVFDLIDRQKRQPDSRLTVEQLEIIKRASMFSDKIVTDVLIPRKEVKTILASDTIGPILINELHENAQAYVLVKETKKGIPIGSLAFKDLDLTSKGQVQNIMNETLYYLNENDSLSEALHAFFVTNEPLFTVVNSFEEYVGIVTIEAIITELLGHVPGSEFEAYTDSAAVAKKYQELIEEIEIVDQSVKTDD